ncbi:MAG: prepilin peptidase [Dissulfuribacterales bacterium]
MLVKMDIFILYFLFAVMIVCALFDLIYHKIPNLVTYPSILVIFIYYIFFYGLSGLLFSAAGLFLGVGMFLIPYSMGIMGAGDAKLMGVAGAALGAKGVFITALFTSLIGGMYALILLLLNPSFSRSFLKNVLFKLKIFFIFRKIMPMSELNGEKKQKPPRLYYGVAIALGTLSYISLEAAGYHFLALLD